MDFLSFLRKMVSSNNLPPVLKFFSKDIIDKACIDLENADLQDRDKINKVLQTKAFNFVNIVKTLAPLISSVIRNAVHNACFSERIDSLTMWSHYANNHKGFVLGYPKNNLSFEIMSSQKSMLYPVIYSNKRYDSDDLFAWAVYNSFGISMAMPDKLANIKTAINKSSDWSYEYEWRLINPIPVTKEDGAIPVKLVPTEIYYGEEISKDDKMLLHNIAIKKNMAEYDMFIDYASSDYALIYRKAII